MQVLIVKTSSLGDIVHALPALEDAHRAFPQARFDWLAERPFVQIPSWHPAVDRVISCDLRGWRRDLRHSLFGGEWKRFRHQLRERAYDLIIDAQGLVKSAWLASQARGPLAGPDRRSAREPLAAAFYRHAYPIPAHDQAHAVERLRRLFAQALEYPLPQTPPVAGLSPQRFPRPHCTVPYALLLHGTTWPSKRWPIEHWIALGKQLSSATSPLRVLLPWGSEEEKQAAETIAAACGGQVLPRLDLESLASWLAHARLVIGVDTGLAHLAAALGTPQITLYGPTLPELTGAVGARQLWLKSTEVATIDRERPTTVTVERVVAAVSQLSQHA